jgi:hypothetical protein
MENVTITERRLRNCLHALTDAVASYLTETKGLCPTPELLTTFVRSAELLKSLPPDMEELRLHGHSPVGLSGV